MHDARPSMHGALVCTWPGECTHCEAADGARGLCLRINVLSLQHLDQGRDSASIKDLLPVVLSPSDTPDRGRSLGLQGSEIVRVRVWGIGFRV
jgi:hypothetical protein